MKRTLKAVCLISVLFALVSCSGGSKNCVGCGDRAELKSFEFPNGVTEDDLNEIFDDLQMDNLARTKDGSVSVNQKICYNCLETAKENVQNCFRCSKIIFTDFDKHVQVCEDCSEVLTKYIDDLMIKIPAEEKTDGQILDFYVSKFETSQGFYKMIMGDNPSLKKGNNRPVECIRDTDIEQFCERLSEITGTDYRLLTNLEFDLLVKNVKVETKEDLAKIAWTFYNSSEVTHEVGTTPESTEYGIYDLIGNVYETVQNENGEYRRRGGSFVNSLFKSNPEYEALGADINLCDKGFRIAHDAE